MRPQEASPHAFNRLCEQTTMLLLFLNKKANGSLVIRIVCPCRCPEQMQTVPLFSHLKALERAEQWPAQFRLNPDSVFPGDRHTLQGIPTKIVQPIFCLKRRSLDGICAHITLPPCIINPITRLLLDYLTLEKVRKKCPVSTCLDMRRQQSEHSDPCLFMP